jgi:hypothetical protein
MGMSLLRFRGYALAARREAFTYRARHSAEQKCNTWPACSKGNEISGEMCVPHHGSRCSGIAFRAAPGREPDMRATSRNTIEMSLRTNHASPRLVNRSIRACSFTRPDAFQRPVVAQPAARALPTPAKSGASEPGLPLPPESSPMNSALEPVAQPDEFSQRAKAVSTKDQS